MPNIEQLIRENFPFPEFNPGQYEAIDRTIRALLAKKKHVILEAPTGIGKSAIATTVHRVLRKMSLSHRTTIITATKGLQDQYQNDDTSIQSLMGRSNYNCPHNVGPYNSSKCKQLQSAGGCTKASTCPYFKTRERWRNEADLRLTNAAFHITAPVTLIGEDDNRANLLVIDECHVIDEQLVDHATLTIDMADLTHVESVCGKAFGGLFTTFINAFMEHNTGQSLIPDKDMQEIASKLANAIEAKLTELDTKLKEGGARKDSIATAIDELEQYSESLLSFANSSGEWIVNEFGYATKVVLQPVYAYQVVNRGLYEKADQFIHMSATICGHSEYMRNLGIKPAEAECIMVANPIDKSQRVVHGLNVIKVSGDYDRHRLASFVDKIIKRHPDECGIIHTVSFALAKDIVANSEYSSRMLVSNNREEILNHLKRKGNVIVSPSVEEGYDFKGDLARWQIIAKVPFEYLGSPWIALNASRSSKWYARKAIVRIVQASGRAVRGLTDHATTYILDSNFQRLLGNNRELFPTWYLDSLEMR